MLNRWRLPSFKWIGAAFIGGLFLSASAYGSYPQFSPMQLRDPASLAQFSTLIVEAKIRSKGPLIKTQALDRHPTLSRLMVSKLAQVSANGLIPTNGVSVQPVSVLTQDIVLEDVKVLWKDPGVAPQFPHVVRLVKFAHRLGSLKPNLLVGERVILCLTDVDELSSHVGLAHWRILNDEHGAFVIRGDNVYQRITGSPSYFDLSHQDPLAGWRNVRRLEELPVGELKEMLQKGVERREKDDEGMERFRAWKRRHLRGVPVKEE